MKLSTKEGRNPGFLGYEASIPQAPRAAKVTDGERVDVAGLSLVAPAAVDVLPEALHRRGRSFTRLDI